MANRSGVLAAEAYVELSADDMELIKSLNTSERALNRFGKSADRAVRKVSNVERVFSALSRSVKKTNTFIARSMRSIFMPMQKVSRLVFDVLAPGIFYLGTVASIMGGAIVAATASATKSFMNLEDVTSRFEVVFERNAGAARKWARGFASNIRFAESTVMETMATFRGFFGAQGFDPQIADQMSMGLAQLVPDLASFFESDPKTIEQKLFSGLTGQAEAVRQLGVDVYERSLAGVLENMGIDPSAATQQQKVMARYNQIIKGTVKAQGDLSRTSDSVANSLQRLLQRIKSLKEEIGQQLSLFLATGLEVANELLGQLITKIKSGNWVKFAKIIVAIGGGLLAFGVLSTTIAPIVTAFGTMATFATVIASGIVAIVTGFLSLSTTIAGTVLPLVAALTKKIISAGKAFTTGIVTGSKAVASGYDPRSFVPPQVLPINHEVVSPFGSFNLGRNTGPFSRLGKPGSLSGLISTIILGVKKGFKQLNFASLFKGLFKGAVLTALGTLIIEALFLEPIRAIFSQIKEAFSAAFASFTKFSKALGSTFVFALKVAGLVKGAFESLFAALSAGNVEGAANVIKATIDLLIVGFKVGLETMSKGFKAFFEGVGKAISKLLSAVLIVGKMLSEPIKTVSRFRRAAAGAQEDLFGVTINAAGEKSTEAGRIAEKVFMARATTDEQKEFAKNMRGLRSRFGFQGTLAATRIGGFTEADVNAVNAAIDARQAELEQVARQRVVKAMMEESNMSLGAPFKGFMDEIKLGAQAMFNDPRMKEARRNLLMAQQAAAMGGRAGSGVAGAGPLVGLTPEQVASMGDDSVKNSIQDAAASISSSVSKAGAESASIFERGVFTKFKSGDKLTGEILSENKKQNQNLARINRGLQEQQMMGVAFA